MLREKGRVLGAIEKHFEGLKISETGLQSARTLADTAY
jgi:hypothetical protein